MGNEISHDSYIAKCCNPVCLFSPSIFFHALCVCATPDGRFMRKRRTGFWLREKSRREDHLTLPAPYGQIRDDEYSGPPPPTFRPRADPSRSTDCGCLEAV